MRLSVLITALTFLASASVCSYAANIPVKDVDGSHDHPMISRFAGSVIGGYQQVDYDMAILPLGRADWKNPDHFVKTDHVEGKITRILYVAPKGKTGLEVFRNFQSALTGAGFNTRFECAGDDGEHGCGGMDFADYLANPLYDPMRARNLMVDTLNAVNDNVRALTANLIRPEGRVDISLLVSQSDTYPVGVLLQVVEAKPMATKQVTVDAKAMSQGLAQSGHIALYGINFASDSAVLTADSDATLGQMAALLKSQAALKVYVVGHTDNSGTLAHNIALSQQRAAAVVKALTTRYGITAARLAAKGVASYAPVASNKNSVGQARNRRVELVEQ